MRAKGKDVEVKLEAVRIAVREYGGWFFYLFICLLQLASWLLSTGLRAMSYVGSKWVCGHSKGWCAWPGIWKGQCVRSI